MEQIKENYIKTIFSIMQETGVSEVKAAKIAKKLSVSAPAVSEMVKRLVEDGVVESGRYKGVKLTKKGNQKGAEMVRHHRLWETYLSQVLGIPWDKVHDEAERLEHACSTVVINKLEEVLGFPTEDPHGNPIPNRKGEISHPKDVTRLSECKGKDKGVVRRVVGLDKQILKYLESADIMIGKAIEIYDVFEFDGSIRVQTQTKEVTLTHQVANFIYIQKT